MGNHKAALPLYTRALEISEAVLGPRHPDTANTLNNLAGLHTTMGTHKAALPLLMRALEISEAVLGPRHPSTASSLNNLATLHSDMGNHKKALPLYTRALEIDEAVLGPRHPHTATSHSNLVMLQKHLDKENEVDGTGQRRLTGQCVTITDLAREELRRMLQIKKKKRSGK